MKKSSFLKRIAKARHQITENAEVELNTSPNTMNDGAAVKSLSWFRRIFSLNLYKRTHFFTPLLMVIPGVFLYLVIGIALVYKIDDSLTFRPETPTEGGSYTVDIITALIRREVSTHSWVANALPFMPSYYIDNMPNYQKGIVSAISRFVVELTDQIGRSRGSSQADNNLIKAQGAIKYDGNKWSIVASASADKNYLLSAKSLEDYNINLSKKQAIFDIRADSLQQTLERMSADLGSVSAVLNKGIDDRTFFFLDAKSDDNFFNAKGTLYAYAMIMLGLEKDFKTVIESRGLKAVWAQALTSLQNASQLNPILIINASPDSLILPSHLTAIGFYLLRARTQIKEITDILQR